MLSTSGRLVIDIDASEHLEVEVMSLMNRLGSGHVWWGGEGGMCVERGGGSDGLWGGGGSKQWECCFVLLLGDLCLVDLRRVILCCVGSEEGWFCCIS